MHAPLCVAAVQAGCTCLPGACVCEAARPVQASSHTPLPVPAPVPVPAQVSLAAGGMGLGMMWGTARAQQMLAAAGFDVEVLAMEGDSFNTHYLCRPAALAAEPLRGEGR